LEVPGYFHLHSYLRRASLSARMLRSADSACVSIPAQLVPEPAPGTSLQWRTDLAATQVHWDSWYVGLSELFLRCKAVKGLVLAGIERLDRELTIGQIQVLDYVRSLIALI
jgi:hypothetical protein